MTQEDKEAVFKSDSNKEVKQNYKWAQVEQVKELYHKSLLKLAENY